MDYARSLKQARQHLGAYALAIRGGEVSPLSELIEQAESVHPGSLSPR